MLITFTLIVLIFSPKKSKSSPYGEVISNNLNSYKYSSLILIHFINFLYLYLAHIDVSFFIELFI